MDRKEYIEREALKRDLIDNRSFYPAIVKNAIEEAPAADVVEVRHGYWILWKPRMQNRNATYKCSVCGKLRSSYYNDVGEWKFCPCGAKMDGERKEQR